MCRRPAVRPLTRRALLSSAAMVSGLAAAHGLSAPPPTRAQKPPTANGPASALQRLIDGNQRFAAGLPSQADISSARRSELATGQAPIAAIVSCSDSRVPPEIIFDQGLGDLFVCRVAGNFVDPGIAGSVEYSIAVLGASLVFVLGHGSCGAVKAAVEAVEGAGPISPNIDIIVEDIRPSVERAEGRPGNLLDNAIAENVRVGLERLRAEPPIAAFLASGAISLAGGVYNLASGLVELVS